jgi:polar amino acid transport system substrate-binding protein
MSTPFRAKPCVEAPTPSASTSEQALQKNEQGIKAKLDNIPTVGQASIGNFELADIIDVRLLQSLVNDFFSVARIPMAIVDMKGRVLVGVGWQHICTDFHRVHPETCKNCIESDTRLTAGITPGEFKLYKCNNNMWDIATPLVVCNQHVGNIFSGQFVFDDEPVDVDFFRAQAQRYGFDEAQYLAGLEAVPRLSREHVNTCMTFLTKLAHMISQMSYSNIELARSLAEYKRSQEALIRSEKLASVGRMAATVAHEINNPLEAVTNCIYIAATHPNLPSEVKEHLETAERELKQISDITRRTLGFYRENAKPSMVDIRTLVGEVVELYSSKFRSKDIRLSVEHDGCCAQVVAVAGEIRQVISNLLANAIDASKSKGIVNVRTSRVSLNGTSYTRVTVADGGMGIPPENQSRIFEPFFTTKEKVGTGLGLWVSQQIIEKHKGRIRLRSVEGKGTAFSVFLPELQTEDSKIA